MFSGEEGRHEACEDGFEHEGHACQVCGDVLHGSVVEAVSQCGSAEDEEDKGRPGVGAAGPGSGFAECDGQWQDEDASEERGECHKESGAVVGDDASGEADAAGEAHGGGPHEEQ